MCQATEAETEDGGGWKWIKMGGVRGGAWKFL